MVDIYTMRVGSRIRAVLDSREIESFVVISGAVANTNVTGRITSRTATAITIAENNAAGTIRTFTIDSATVVRNAAGNQVNVNQLITNSNVLIEMDAGTNRARTITILGATATTTITGRIITRSASVVTISENNAAGTMHTFTIDSSTIILNASGNQVNINQLVNNANIQIVADVGTNRAVTITVLGTTTATTTITGRIITRSASAVTISENNVAGTMHTFTIDSSTIILNASGNQVNINQLVNNANIQIVADVGTNRARTINILP